MFTVVGLLGMTGIIINDSIVLITTIDDYAKDRGVIPSIMDGAADRLRPVFLTTATTVLGLAPLLFERSAQAQFLKPTVITLVYGLGFGMFLVLLVVPALVAIQYDVTRQMQALRRAPRAKGIRAGVALCAGVIAAWLVATFGWVLLKGEVHPILSQTVLPSDTFNSTFPALLLFLIGAWLISFGGYLVGIAWMMLRAWRKLASA
jgi:hypothetical protein